MTFSQMTKAELIERELGNGWTTWSNIAKTIGGSVESVKAAAKTLRKNGIRIQKKRDGYQSLFRIHVKPASAAKPRGGAQMAEGKGKMPAVYYVREALKDFPAPATADRGKVMAAAQSLARQAGESFAIVRGDVSNAMLSLSRRYNGYYTTDDIVKYQEAWLQDRKGHRYTTRRKAAQKTSTALSVGDQCVSRLDDFLDVLQQARSFVKKAGGRDQAMKLIDVLQGD